MNEEINKIPNIDQTMKFVIDYAEMLFKDKKLKIRDTEAYGDDPERRCIRIYINNSLSLWFYKEKDGTTRYDGWEMGDYSNQ